MSKKGYVERKEYFEAYYLRNKERLKDYRDTRKVELKKYFKARFESRKWDKDIFLKKLYCTMLSRTKGRSTGSVRTYLGLPILPREQFLDWACKNETFHSLYAGWVDSGHDLRFTPSVDRIDSNKGYLIDNIRWLTLSENCSLGRKERGKKPWSKPSQS